MGAAVSETDNKATNLHATIARQLTSQRYVYTRRRRELVEALLTATAPMTVPDIAATAPALSASSAYRNLDVLERCGVVHRIRSTGDHTHFELAEPLLGHHHHLICVGCGEIRDIHLTKKLEQLVEQNLAAAADQAKFTPLHHSLDLYGRCADCEQVDDAANSRA